MQGATKCALFLVSIHKKKTVYHDKNYKDLINLCQYVLFNIKYLQNYIDIKYQSMVLYLINF